MTILYFTATGNSLEVAEKIWDNLISIVQCVKKEQYEFTDDKIGLVFPTYALCVPPYIKDFLMKAKFNTKYLFSVITYGDEPGAVENDLDNFSKEINIHFNYIKKIKMVESCLTRYEMKKQIDKFDKKTFENELNEIIEDIKQEKEYIIKNSKWNRFLTYAHKKMYPYPIGKGETDNFYVTNLCNQCQTCVKVCPNNNIILEDKEIKFGYTCLSCMACIQNCPNKAIRNSKEKSLVRYRNENVSLSEIINANE